MVRIITPDSRLPIFLLLRIEEAAWGLWSINGTAKIALYFNVTKQIKNHRVIN